MAFSGMDVGWVGVCECCSPTVADTIPLKVRLKQNLEGALSIGRDVFPISCTKIELPNLLHLYACIFVVRKI